MPPRTITKRTLMVVDDEPDVLDSLRHLFHRTYRVLTAGSGAEALRLLDANEVHVILSDQRMPGMTGDAFLAVASRVQPDAIRMIFTGYADLESVVRAVNEGHIFRYIVKPWDPSELESIIRQAVEQFDLLTDRKRLIAELQAANGQLTQAILRLSEASELKSAFIEVAGHEFNTPITIVLGLSELLLLQCPDRDPTEAMIVEQISAASRQLGKLVADTLKLMRSDDFRQAIQRSPVDLTALLREAAARLAPFVLARGMTFEVDVADDLGTFEVDATKVSDATLNLLTNALKFTRDGGRIGLSAQLASPDEARVVVWDQGIGLDPRSVKRLFEPFFTEFDPSRHSTGDFGFEKRGLGLGLCIVRQFVELHGGHVEAESEPGCGTRVTFSLPRRPFPEPTFEVELNVPDPGTTAEGASLA